MLQLKQCEYGQTRKCTRTHLDMPTLYSWFHCTKCNYLYAIGDDLHKNIPELMEKNHDSNCQFSSKSTCEICDYTDWAFFIHDFSMKDTLKYKHDVDLHVCVACEKALKDHVGNKEIPYLGFIISMLVGLVTIAMFFVSMNAFLLGLAFFALSFNNFGLLKSLAGWNVHT